LVVAMDSNPIRSYL